MRPRACFEAIGFVEEGIPRGGHGSQSRYSIISTVRVYDEYVDGLRGLDEYSHVVVIYWMHEEVNVKLTLRPWGDEKAPLVGIFATRFPPRPNPIGVTVVELVSLEPPRLRLRGLDAWTGTPVLDIKPYDYYDIVKRPRVPRWFEDRWAMLSAARGYDMLAPWLGPCQ